VNWLRVERHVAMGWVNPQVLFSGSYFVNYYYNNNLKYELAPLVPIAYYIGLHIIIIACSKLKGSFE